MASKWWEVVVEPAAALLAGLSGCQPKTVQINVSRPDEEVIKEVESYIPLGEPASKVLAVIHSRFRNDGMVSGNRHRGVFTNATGINRLNYRLR